MHRLERILIRFVIATFVMLASIARASVGAACARGASVHIVFSDCYCYYINITFCTNTKHPWPEHSTQRIHVEQNSWNPSASTDALAKSTKTFYRFKNSVAMSYTYDADKNVATIALNDVSFAPLRRPLLPVPLHHHPIQSEKHPRTIASLLHTLSLSLGISLLRTSSAGSAG